MTHTVTGKLNNNANMHNNGSGTTFFIRLGEKNYNYKSKAAEWTNYEAAVFVKDNQVQFYQDALVEGAIVSVTGKGLIVENDAQYGVKLHIQDPRVVYANNPSSAPAPQQQTQPQQQYQQPAAPQAPQHQEPKPQYAAPPAMDSFDYDIPF